jgi:hypothetical protein
MSTTERTLGGQIRHGGISAFIRVTCLFRYNWAILASDLHENKTMSLVLEELLMTASESILCPGVGEAVTDPI